MVEVTLLDYLPENVRVKLKPKSNTINTDIYINYEDELIKYSKTELLQLRVECLKLGIKELETKGLSPVPLTRDYNKIIKRLNGIRDWNYEEFKEWLKSKRFTCFVCYKFNTYIVYDVESDRDKVVNCVDAIWYKQKFGSEIVPRCYVERNIMPKIKEQLDKNEITEHEYRRRIKQAMDRCLRRRIVQEFLGYRCFWGYYNTNTQ